MTKPAGAEAEPQERKLAERKLVKVEVDGKVQEKAGLGAGDATDNGNPPGRKQDSGHRQPAAGAERAEGDATALPYDDVRLDEDGANEADPHAAADTPTWATAPGGPWHWTSERVAASGLAAKNRGNIAARRGGRARANRRASQGSPTRA